MERAQSSPTAQKRKGRRKPPQKEGRKLTASHSLSHMQGKATAKKCQEKTTPGKNKTNQRGKTHKAKPPAGNRSNNKKRATRTERAPKPGAAAEAADERDRRAALWKYAMGGEPANPEEIRTRVAKLHEGQRYNAKTYGNGTPFPACRVHHERPAECGGTRRVVRRGAAGVSELERSISLAALLQY